MFKLIDKDGNTIQGTNEMVKETRRYYENLYSEREILKKSLEEYTKIPKLEKEEAESLEGLIQYEEAASALKNMKNGKSPGTDGFTVEFLKFFWNKLGHFIIRSLNEGFKSDKLSITQREGLIVCIPKGDKPREFLKNWRPISLLNVIYKIGSASIANRLKRILPKLIHEDQTGFVKGRYIGDNIRLLYDMIHHLDEEKLPGLLVSIDYEKAFDSVDWNFMHSALEQYGFGKDILHWIQTFYKEIKSSVIVNGKVSESFHVKRGCRQGDPISPYLFILCAEILACKIRNNEEIKGIKVDNTEFKISQFADDTTFLLEGDRNSYETLFDQLDEFSSISGLKLNHEKTANIWIGSKRNSQTRWLSHLDMTWNPDKIKILGLWFTNDLKDMGEMNLNDKFYEIRTLFRIWLNRTSTPIGRSVILKSLILSKLIYLWILLPNPPEILIQNLQKECFDFVWDKKRDKIKRTLSIHHYKEGGINVPHISNYIKSLKLGWLKKTVREKQPKWMHILKSKGFKTADMDTFGTRMFTNRFSNPFWKDVFNAYNDLDNKMKPKDADEFLAEPLFKNNKFKIANETIHYEDWVTNHIFLVKHLLKDNGSFMTLQEFQGKYDFNPRPLEFFGCISSIAKFKKANKYNVETNETKTISRKNTLLFQQENGSRNIYNALIPQAEVPNAWKNWENLLEQNLNWNKTCKNLSKIKESKLKWFQIRICHRILVTNSILMNMGITENNTCNFCLNERDTVLHYLWKCVHVKMFWQDFERTLKNECAHCDRLSMNPILILFGNDGKNTTDDGFDFILLNAKYYVYKCRLNKTLPRMDVFKKDLNYVYNIDKHVHIIEMTLEKFHKKWQLYQHLLL